MIYLSVHKLQGGTLCVSQSDFSKALYKEYSEEQATKIFSDFQKLMVCSTIPVIQQSPPEDGVYLHDLRAIAEKLQLSIEFLDSDGAVTDVSGSLSGIIR